MKSGKPGSSRKKILYYYFFGVVLPGIILGYMAFRGIRNDQAILEQESLKKLETSSRLFFSELDSGLASFLDMQTSDSLYLLPANRHPSLLIHFIHESTGRKKLISHQLLYAPPEYMKEQPEESNTFSLLEEGRRLEFADQFQAHIQHGSS